ncbi:hypothetical protein [Pseudonocardia sp. NPDC049635]|uniref:hypothetical protein n=1 Tax=Pseudonocardia sp. NPDC049635 TaxID=3155506 RepID=UPI0033F930B1
MTRLTVYAGHLCSVVDAHTCGAGGDMGHEPQCGLDPIATVEEVRTALAASDVTTNPDGEHDAVPAAAPTDGQADGPEYAIIETNRGGGVEYPVAERNTNGPTGWMIGGEFVPDVAVTHVEPVTVLRASAAPADDTAAPDGFPALARKLADLSVECTFWACPGPDTEPEDMVTCRTCWLIWEARQLFAAARPARDGGEPK